MVTHMKNAKRRNMWAAALNILMFLMVTASVLWFFAPAESDAGLGNMSTRGTGCFRFFTNDSNILAALISLVTVPFNIKSARSGKDEIPGWLLTLKMTGTAAVTLTMTVVIFFLGPTQGYVKMFSGVCLPLHLLCPLISIVTFCFLERGRIFTKKRLLWAVVPTVVYGTVYLVCVIFLGEWADFYGFNIGGYWYVSYAIMPAVTYLLALLIGALHNRSEKR